MVKSVVKKAACCGGQTENTGWVEIMRGLRCAVRRVQHCVEAGSRIFIYLLTYFNYYSRKDGFIYSEPSQFA